MAVQILQYAIETNPKDILIGLAALICCYFVIHKLWKTNKSPPGPWSLPFVGYLPFLGKEPHKKLLELSKQYGDVMSIKFGSWDAVVLSGYDTIKEAMVTQGDIFSGRPNFKTPKMLSYGISETTTFSFSPPTKKYSLQKRIAGESLNLTIRNKERPIADIMVTEAIILAEEFIKNGDCVTPETQDKLLGISNSCTIYDILYGNIVDGNIRENADFLKYISGTDAVRELLNGPIDVVPGWCEIFFQKQINNFYESWKQFMAIVDKISESHDTSYDPDHIRDTYDCGIKLISKTSKEEMDGAGIGVKELRYAIHDLFGAAAETTTTALKWILLYLVGYPDIQDKLFEEINGVIGDQQPCLEDVKRLPLVEAYILEVLRCGNVAPLLLPHSTITDTHVKGYFIPKDTLVWVNSFSIHNDENIWEDPEKFWPERFLTDSNELNRNLSRKIAAFGFGKRRCTGEQIVKHQLFLFTVILLQKCNFKQLPDHDMKFNGDFHLSFRPNPFSMSVFQRE